MGILISTVIAGLIYVIFNSSFWDWMHTGHESQKWWMAKREIACILLFLVIPVCIYLLIDWDPVIGRDEDGEPVQLGMWIVAGLYWIGAYFSYKRHETRWILNQLLDGLLNSDEKVAEHLYNVAKHRRELIRKEGLQLVTGEKRAQWLISDDV